MITVRARRGLPDPLRDQARGGWLSLTMTTSAGAFFVEEVDLRELPVVANSDFAQEILPTVIESEAENILESEFFPVIVQDLLPIADLCDEAASSFPVSVNSCSEERVYAVDIAVIIEGQPENDESAGRDGRLGVFASFPFDTRGKAVLDIGATATVGSLQAIDEIMSFMSGRGECETLRVFPGCQRPFRFGNGQISSSLSYVEIPQRLDGRLIHLGVHTLDAEGCASIAVGEDAEEAGGTDRRCPQTGNFPVRECPGYHSVGGISFGASSS